MRMYGVKNEKKNVIGVIDEKRNLKVEIDVVVFEEVFNKNFDSLNFEVEMIIEGLGDDVKKFVEIRYDEEKMYIAKLNGVKYEFDY